MCSEVVVSRWQAVASGGVGYRVVSARVGPGGDRVGSDGGWRAAIGWHERATRFGNRKLIGRHEQLLANRVLALGVPAVSYHTALPGKAKSAML